MSARIYSIIRNKTSESAIANGGNYIVSYCNRIQTVAAAGGYNVMDTLLNDFQAFRARNQYRKRARLNYLAIARITHPIALLISNM